MTDLSNTKTFSTKTFGKWILAGEHAVIRGIPALVFPARSSAMTFSWAATPETLQVNFAGSNGAELSIIFWGVLENALQKIERARTDLRGRLQVTSDIPLGAGLGGSAALCVGIGRWFQNSGFIKASDVYEFSRQLENLFHGESSGVDIAVALEGRGLKFMRGGEHTPLLPTWKPRLYLSYSGKRGVTSECVKKVNELRAKSRHLGEKLDQQMREAVELSERALLISDSGAVDLLAKALDLARDCFYQWGLCEGVLDQHMRELLRAGALSVKPTGSGGGGHVLSLWDAPPPASAMASPLIPLFE
jgi:mevalonate kinase